MKNSLILKNCLLYNSADNSDIDDIFIKNGRIIFVGKNYSEEEDAEVIDINGKLTAPGLIDVHIQGAGGSDILDGTTEAIQTISKTLARLGTTSFLGATVVKPKSDNYHLRTTKEFVEKNIGGASLLGFHLEGPFINPVKKGGLAEDAIYHSSPEALNEILNITGSSLKMLTIAPEMPGNLTIIKELKNKGIVPAFAHSNANYEETKKGFEAGINHVTHIFNAMPGLHHRDATSLNAIFENEEVTAQIISDGHHLHSSAVKILYKLLGAERCICITDGVQGMGLPEGKYVYNGKEYISKNGAAKYLDGTLIGSTMSLLEIVFKFKEFTGCTLEEAFNTASKNPAKLLGLNKGVLKSGKDADIIVLDTDNSVYLTIVNGEIVYRKQ